MFFFINFILIFLILEAGPLFWLFFDKNFTSHEFFTIEFIVLLFVRYNINELKVYKPVNKDILYKYFIFCFKTPNFLINYAYSTFKKIWLFVIYFKHKQLFSEFFIFFKKHFKNYFLNWKPLFKKTSYFGYYRSNRSKWIK